jgi:hypothetical protein
MRKLLNRKIVEQDRKCAICHEEFTDYNDIVPDHRDPKGMGGAWRDDHQFDADGWTPFYRWDLAFVADPVAFFSELNNSSRVVRCPSAFVEYSNTIDSSPRSAAAERL